MNLVTETGCNLLLAAGRAARSTLRRARAYIYMYASEPPPALGARPLRASQNPSATLPRTDRTASLHTKHPQTMIRRLKLSGKFPMGLGVPPLRIKIRLNSNPLESRILVRRLAVGHCPLKEEP